MTSVARLPDVPPLLRVKGPADLIQAVPYLLGFSPAESLVAVALRGRRQRLDFTLRLDLSDGDGAVGKDARLVADYVAKNDADAAVLLVYTDVGEGGGVGKVGKVGGSRGKSGEVGGLPRRGLVDAVARQLELRGICLQDALLVSRGRWRSYICTDVRCCPPEGTPLPAPEEAAASVVATTATYAGLNALPSREALVASLRPVRSVARAAMAQALARAQDARNQLSASGTSPAAMHAHTRQLLVGCLAGFDNPPVSVSDDEAAAMILGIADIPMRDEVCDWAVGEHPQAVRSLLTYLVRRALAPYDVAPLTVLGVVAYQQGDGALASVALNRALLADPTYRLALLAEEALRRGVRPEVLRKAVGQRPS